MAPIADKVDKLWMRLCVVCAQNLRLHTKVFILKEVTVCPQGLWKESSGFFLTFLLVALAGET